MVGQRVCADGTRIFQINAVLNEGAWQFLTCHVDEEVAP
jgi:hypothetical protein